ncbi:MAG: DUF1549 domain-containing protein [Pirellulales bacterium]
MAGPYPGQVTAKTVEPIRYDQLDDMVAAIGSSVLGMTIGCARCHDHKYDPIGHRDYYAMIARLGKAVQRETDIDPDPATTKQKHDAWLAERAGFELAKAVDGDAGTGWTVGGEAGKDHAAVFAFEKPLGFDEGTLLTVELKFEAGQHGLARLRLAASTHAEATDLGSTAVPQAGREGAHPNVSKTHVDNVRRGLSDVTEACGFKTLRDLDRHKVSTGPVKVSGGPTKPSRQKTAASASAEPPARGRSMPSSSP